MKKWTLIFPFAMLFLTGCVNLLNRPTEPVTPTAAVQEVTPTDSVPTPIPFVIKVNDIGITDDEYISELTRFQQANTNTDQKEAARVVQENMTFELLLADSAYKNGFSMDNAALSAKIDELKNQIGGEDVYQTWLSAQGYSADSFKAAYLRSSAAAWMRDKIAEETPKDAPQVHVQQILLLDEAEAKSVLEQIRAGSDFATLASEYDPITKGDLGWFPKGYLTQKVVDDTVFALQAGEISEVISSEVGYHILWVIEFF